MRGHPPRRYRKYAPAPAHAEMSTMATIRRTGTRVLSVRSGVVSGRGADIGGDSRRYPQRHVVTLTGTRRSHVGHVQMGVCGVFTVNVSAAPARRCSAPVFHVERLVRKRATYNAAARSLHSLIRLTVSAKAPASLAEAER